MSNWAYISGSADIIHPTDYYDKDNKKFIIENADEQVVLDYDGWFEPYEVTTYEHAEVGQITRYRVRVAVNSYPISREIIKKHIHLLPNGEYDTIQYYLNESKQVSSSMCGIYSYDEAQADVYNKAIELAKAAGYDIPEENTNTEVVIERSNCPSSILTINDSVRYCTVDDLYEGLIKFINKLINDGIFFNLTSFRCYDDYGAEIVLKEWPFSNNCFIIENYKSKDYDGGRKRLIGKAELIFSKEKGILTQYSKNWGLRKVEDILTDSDDGDDE